MTRRKNTARLGREAEERFVQEVADAERRRLGTSPDWEPPTNPVDGSPADTTTPGGGGG
ncbi:MAG: hypothetical protein NUV59_01620 [Patescibacteria group bacterium]|nr:hypothetical protein [Patescibacteria group bacterium]